MPRSSPLGLVLLLILVGCGAGAEDADTWEAVDLPRPDVSGPFESVLAARRSVRDYGADELTPDQIGQLLWAAQGVTQTGGRGRAAPSAGGLYPLEMYVTTSDGLFHYLPDGHRLERVGTVDLRRALHDAGLEQEALLRAPAVFVLTAIPSRTESQYGSRAERYVILEAGHAAQNLLLQAVALDLAAVPIGAFSDDEVARALGLAPGERPLYLIPVGTSPTSQLSP